MGKTVVIDHGNGDYSVYGHLKSVSIAKGKCVKAGDSLGSVGYTGNGQCLKDKNLISHLHFADFENGQAGTCQGGRSDWCPIKNAEDWMEISQEFFGGDMLDLGVEDPEVMLQNAAGCLR